jgi:hypothetical protein
MIAPHQPQINIVVKAHPPKGPLDIFKVNKSNYDENSEGRGKPLNIVCSIDLEPDLSVGNYWGTVVEVK